VLLNWFGLRRLNEDCRDMPPVKRERAPYSIRQGRSTLSFHMVTHGRACTGWAYDTSIRVLTASIAVSQITALGRADAIKQRRRVAVLDRADHC
jgi:hypothetical protein